MFASMNTIIPGLYLGDMEAAEDLDMLRENNISRILIAGCNLYKHYPQEFVYHQIEVDDMSNVDMLSHFTGCVAFIAAALGNNEHILVHCAAGVSRSTTIVIAYLMQLNKWDFDTTFDFTKKKRKCVNPNMGFRDQLKLYHQLEYKVNKEDPSVKQSLEDLLAKRPYYWR